MTRNTLSKYIVSCFLVFVCFSSHFALAASSMDSVDDVQGLEAMKIQEKNRAEQLVLQIDTAEDPEQIVRELEIIQNNIQEYNLRLERLRKIEVAAPAPAVAEIITEAPDTNNGSLFWKVMIIIIIGGVIFLSNEDSSSSSSSASDNRSENVVQTELPRRTFAQSTSTRTESSSQPLSQLNQIDIQDLVNKGAKRLKSKKWQQSQASQNGEIPPELL